ncbi:glycosyltransferase family 1 protein [Krasilnikovia sp. M28-CT-15]|uniref:glycosyltransferase family 1 protein n=1 Tax=Krasilnikovia sp. M28-CT-15 TaxID=3373540 RepID=UPI0038770D2A
MIRVLLIADGPPRSPHTLAEKVRQWSAAGAEVALASGVVSRAMPELPAELAQVLAVPPLPQKQRLAAFELPGGEKLWRRFHRVPAARRLGARADVVVALDSLAVHTAWQLARRHRGADVVFGLAPAERAIAARAARPVRHAARRVFGRGPVPRVAAAALGRRARRYSRWPARAATGTRVHRTAAGRAFWQTVVCMRRLPSGVRLPLTRRVCDSLQRAGMPERSDRTLLAAAHEERHLGRRAELLGGQAARAMAEGTMPSYLTTAVQTGFAAADQAYSDGDLPTAARQFCAATRVLFHRGVHLDSLTSPAVADPYAFAAPLRDSAVGRELAVPRGRSGHPRQVTGRPHRILFLYRKNDTFLSRIRERYAEHPDAEVRSVDLVRSPGDPTSLARLRPRFVEHQLRGTSPYGDMFARLLQPHLEWADTVFVEWCTGAAAAVTLVDPGSTRIIVRLHSFEAFTEVPHLIDYSRVDDMIYVSDHLRDFVQAAVPRLRAPAAPRAHVLPNAMDLRPYARPKAPDARFTVGLVGIHSMAKDPRWAIQVARRLREHDERYRLLVIGGQPGHHASRAARNYYFAYTRERRELERDGALQRYGQTDDVAQALTEVGVILSSSVRESWHCGLVEGAASGAVPVVRDWPFFAGRAHGARSLFPSDWVVPDVGEAVDRILAVTSSEEVWRATGAAAAEHTCATWDWPVVGPQFDRVLLGG